VYPTVHLVELEPHIQRPERDVVVDGRHEQLIVGVLEDQAHPLAHLTGRLGRQRDPIDCHRSSLRHEDAIHVEDECGFARPIRTEQRDPLSGGDRQVDSIQ